MGNFTSQNSSDKQPKIGGDELIINNVHNLKNLENKLIEFLNTTGFISNGILDFSNYIKQLDHETNPNEKNLSESGYQDAINGIKDYLSDGLNMEYVKHYNNDEVLSAGYSLLSNISNTVLNFMDEDKASLNYNINNLNKMHDNIDKGVNSLNSNDINNNVLHMLNKTADLLDEQQSYLSLINESDDFKNTQNKFKSLNDNINNLNMENSNGQNILQYMNNIVHLTENINEFRNIRKLYDDDKLFMNSMTIQNLKVPTEHLDNDYSFDSLSNYIVKLYDTVDSNKNLIIGSGKKLSKLQNKLLLNKNWDSSETVKNIINSENQLLKAGGQDALLSLKPLLLNNEPDNLFDGGNNNSLQRKLENQLHRDITKRNQDIIKAASDLNEKLNDLSNNMNKVMPALHSLNFGQLNDLELIFKKFLIFNNFRHKNTYLILVNYYIDLQSIYIKKDFITKIQNLKSIVDVGDKILPQLGPVRSALDNIMKFIDSTGKFIDEKYGITRIDKDSQSNANPLAPQGTKFDPYDTQIRLDINDLPDISVVNSTIVQTVFRLLYSIRLQIFSHKLSKSQNNHNKDYEELVGRTMGSEIDMIKEDYKAIMDKIIEFENSGANAEFGPGSAISLNFPLMVIPIPVKVVDDKIIYKNYEIKKFFMYLPVAPPLNETENDNRDARAWGRSETNWVSYSTVPVNSDPIVGDNFRNMIINYKDYITHHYESIIGLHFVAQAIDNYLMKFTQKLKKTPELVEKLDALLSSSKLAALLHSNKSIDKLINVFDPNNINTPDGAGENSVPQPLIDLISNRKLDKNNNKWDSFIPDDSYKTPYMKMKELKEFHKHNTTLSNILSLFFSLLSVDDIKNSIYSPKTILDYLMNYMCWGSYVFTHTPSTDIFGANRLQAHTTQNMYRFIPTFNKDTVGINDNLSVFNQNYSAINLFDSNIRVGLQHSNTMLNYTNSKFQNTLESKSQILYSNIIKAITGKILTVLGMYDIFDYKNNKPWRTFIMDTTRLTVGGGPEYIKTQINEDAIEFYIRIPLLLKFYKTIFYDPSQDNSNIKNKFTSSDNKSVKIIPDFNYPFNDLIKHYFMFYDSKNTINMTTNMSFNSGLFDAINKVYDFYSKQNISKTKLLNHAAQELVTEVNNKYGLLFESDLTMYKSQIAKKFGYNQYDIENETFFGDYFQNDIYDGESLLITDSKDNSALLPSQKYSKVSEPYKSNVLTNKTSFNAKQYYDNISNFRTFIQSVLTESINDKGFSEKYNLYSSFFDIDEYVTDIKNVFKDRASMTIDEKIIFLSTAAHAKNPNIFNIESNKKQLLYDFVITPLKQINNLLDFLAHVRAAFSNEIVDSISKTTINKSEPTYSNTSSRYIFPSNGSLVIIPAANTTNFISMQGNANVSTRNIIQYLISKLLKNSTLFGINVSSNIQSSFVGDGNTSISFGKIDGIIQKQLQNVNKIINEFKIYVTHDTIYSAEMFLKIVNSQYHNLFQLGYNKNNESNKTTIYDIQHKLNKFMTSSLDINDINTSANGINIKSSVNGTQQIVKDLNKIGYDIIIDFINPLINNKGLPHQKITTGLNVIDDQYYGKIPTEYLSVLQGKSIGQNSNAQLLHTKNMVYAEPNPKYCNFYFTNIINSINHIIGTLLKAASNDTDKRIYNRVANIFNNQNDILNINIDNKFQNISQLIHEGDYGRSGHNMSYFDKGAGYKFKVREQQPYSDIKDDLLVPIICSTSLISAEKRYSFQSRITGNEPLRETISVIGGQWDYAINTPKTFYNSLHAISSQQFGENQKYFSIVSEKNHGKIDPISIKDSKLTVDTGESDLGLDIITYTKDHMRVGQAIANYNPMTQKWDIFKENPDKSAVGSLLFNTISNISKHAGGGTWVDFVKQNITPKLFNDTSSDTHYYTIDSEDIMHKRHILNYLEHKFIDLDLNLNNENKVMAATHDSRMGIFSTLQKIDDISIYKKLTTSNKITIGGGPGDKFTFKEGLSIALSSDNEPLKIKFEDNDDNAIINGAVIYKTYAQIIKNIQTNYTDDSNTGPILSNLYNDYSSIHSKTKDQLEGVIPYLTSELENISGQIKLLQYYTSVNDFTDAKEGQKEYSLTTLNNAKKIATFLYNGLESIKSEFSIKNFKLGEQYPGHFNTVDITSNVNIPNISYSAELYNYVSNCNEMIIRPSNDAQTVSKQTYYALNGIAKDSNSTFFQRLYAVRKMFDKKNTITMDDCPTIKKCINKLNATLDKFTNKFNDSLILDVINTCKEIQFTPFEENTINEYIITASDTSDPIQGTLLDPSKKLDKITPLKSMLFVNGIIAQESPASDVNVVNKILNNYDMINNDIEFYKNYNIVYDSFQSILNDMIGNSDEINNRKIMKKFKDSLYEPDQDSPGYNHLMVFNILDLNILPIDINALTREIPLFYVFNYAASLDEYFITSMDAYNTEKYIDGIVNIRAEKYINKFNEYINTITDDELSRNKTTLFNKYSHLNPTSPIINDLWSNSNDDVFRSKQMIFLGKFNSIINTINNIYQPTNSYKFIETNQYEHYSESQLYGGVNGDIKESISDYIVTNNASATATQMYRNFYNTNYYTIKFGEIDDNLSMKKKPAQNSAQNPTHDEIINIPYSSFYILSSLSSKVDKEIQSITNLVGFENAKFMQKKLIEYAGNTTVLDNIYGTVATSQDRRVLSGQIFNDIANITDVVKNTGAAITGGIFCTDIVGNMTENMTDENKRNIHVLSNIMYNETVFGYVPLRQLYLLDFSYNFIRYKITKENLYTTSKIISGDLLYDDEYHNTKLFEEAYGGPSISKGTLLNTGSIYPRVKIYNQNSRPDPARPKK